MSKVVGKPFANTNLAKFVTKRILELRPQKTQGQIGDEAGFLSVNMLSIVKSGAAKLPLDRVPDLAKALECDPARLFILAVEQQDTALAVAIRDIFQIAVTANEAVWIEELRDASDDSDPALTTKGRRAIRAVFGK
jgi:hypothetical protein